MSLSGSRVEYATPKLKGGTPWETKAAKRTRKRPTSRRQTNWRKSKKIRGRKNLNAYRNRHGIAAREECNNYFGCGLALISFRRHLAVDGLAGDREAKERITG